MKQTIKRLIPKPLAPLVHRIYYFPIDSFDRLTGRRDALTPPKRLWFVGDGDFMKIGRRFLAYFVEYGGLQSSHRILDVGCGVGRMALPLTSFIGSEGSYEGFDAVAEAVRWCQKHITPKFSNFQFQTADVYNKQYNPKGRLQAESYRFPYADGTFDFVISTSVFTHLLPAILDRYVAEIARVLKPGGRCFGTFFLLNDEARRSISEGRSRMDIGSPFSSICCVMEPDLPERAVGYDEAYIRDLLERRGLAVLDPVRYGRWWGKDDAPAFQDIVLVEKRRQ